MSFAHWRKCDFQVHTPRDPNWSGKRPVGLGDIVNGTERKATDDDVDTARARWAAEFVDQCVAKGLEAVALTDHHEMVMVPYVQQAIADRKESDRGFDLWLFPGMELTASGGKQCLILFDADLSEDWRRQAMGKLGITFADLEEKVAQSQSVTQLSINYADIGRELDTLDGLRDRYIVLPNVSQGGQYTVLVKGGHTDFRRMPYVGGYLDWKQTINMLSRKNRRRLSGNDIKWSSREIYPLPTSDSRSVDYANLGQNNTWIKLAEPTAGAIRQAFLAHRSRISMVQPQTPSLTIVELNIEGSTILQDTTLILSPELNSAIGGRGSGKSSLLEYLSFGLGRSCHDISRDDYSGVERLEELVNDTLISIGGRIVLTMMQDNAIFKIKREESNNYQPQIMYSNGDTKTVTVRELRSLFPAIVYSQGELAEIKKQVGKRAQLTDLLQFASPRYKREDNRLVQDIETTKTELRSIIQQMLSSLVSSAKLNQYRTNLASFRQRADALRKMLPEFSEEDQAFAAYFDKANEFESRRVRAFRHVDQILERLDAATMGLRDECDLNSDLAGEPATMAQIYADIYNTFNTNIKNLENELEAKYAKLGKVNTAWSKSFRKARKGRDVILKKSSEQTNVIRQVTKLEEEVNDYENQIYGLLADLNTAGESAEHLQQAMDNLKNANQIRTERAREWASEIEELSGGKVRAVVDPDGDISEIIDALGLIANQIGLQNATRISSLKDALAADKISNIISRLREECISLLRWQLVGDVDGKGRPSCTELINMLGDSRKIRRLLFERVNVTWVEAISAASTKPEIRLSYCDGDYEIPFEKASEGQRAAVLLFILLEQSGGPLIIDQPEGELDNKIIAELTAKLHDAKQKRQIIFASHNANIVVNGSSELVVHLDIDKDGKRKIACAGAIDKPAVCDVITATMEGGEKAFKDRQNKYGY